MNKRVEEIIFVAVVIALVVAGIFIIGMGRSETKPSECAEPPCEYLKPAQPVSVNETTRPFISNRP